MADENDTGGRLERLAREWGGELEGGHMMRALYATDASVFRELPLAVAFPRSAAEAGRLVALAGAHRLPLIPRAAGTSLAGQVVGDGIVADLGRHLNRILEIHPEEGWVRVEPGVIRNDLNLALRPHGIFFAPETATQNRAMIGGMAGNNSCGANSIRYGSTREHLLEVRGFLSDGSEACFHALDAAGFEAKCEGPCERLETRLYRQIRELLGDGGNRRTIAENYPDPALGRRNTGYALDLLMDAGVLDPCSENPFDFCKLLAGSEGTLMLATEFKLACVPCPPCEAALLAAHFGSVDESLRAARLAMEHDCHACELIDHYILECTKANREQRRNRDFVVGDPAAILLVEMRADEMAEAEAEVGRLTARLREAGLGTHFPVLRGEETGKVWDLRKAGLGVLSNVPGDAKPVAVVEDTAVHVSELPEYIRDFNALLAKHRAECVHYAHAGAGELHLRPLLDLKSPGDRARFRALAEDSADLVKRYRGSLSGEHGDGRLRGELIPRVLGESCCAFLREVKRAWDPAVIFNPGKIVEAPPMDSSLRYDAGKETREFETVFDFSESRGILRGAELCNGSGDCRRTHLGGGTMCPSYMATRDEKDTTRARANILREILTRSGRPNPFDSEEIREVMDLCLSCKGCKAECPSNVDVAKLKAEFLQHYYDANGVPLRSRLVGSFARAGRLASHLPWMWNFVFGNEPLARLAKRAVGFHPDRSIPLLHRRTLSRWMRGRPRGAASAGRRVYLFNDEFTGINDVPVGRAAVELLERLGYEVVIPRHVESGRALLSKGLLRRARRIAIRNVELLAEVITGEAPLLGIEPSAILSFRDEYPELVPAGLRATARRLGERCLMIDEFIAREVDGGRIGPDAFIDEPRLIRLHAHCFQKALASVVPTVRMLELPANYEVRLIPSGCCGMAGAFGYEREHYEVSMKVAELVLLPAVREQPADVLIAAPGTSCRHQIKDGAGRRALHPVEILREALRDGARSGEAERRGR